MSTLTVRGVTDRVMDRLRQQAQAEHRSINQQVLAILDEALPSESQASWGVAYQNFREKWGDSLLTEGEADEIFGELRNTGKGRDANPFE